MSATMNMDSALTVRDTLTRQQEKEIKQLYEEAANNVSYRAEYYRNRRPSATQKQQFLSDLGSSLENNINDISARVERDAKSNAKEVAEAVVKDVNDWGKKVGLDIQGAYAHVPTEAVERLISGKVYQEGRNLSASIWGDNSKTLKDIYSVIASGSAENKSVYDIAKDVEKYVRPGAYKSWEWSKVYPGVKKKVEYNSQRLVRTLLQHAYQESFVQSTINNPFVDSYRWNSAGIHGRTCQICFDRDGQLYEKDKVPLDHPSGLCVITAEISDDWDTIADKLAAWYHAPEGTYQDLDGWRDSMGLAA